MPEFKVPSDINNISIKDYLRRNVGLSLTTWRKVKQAGMLLINSMPALPYTLVRPNDIITVDWPNACTISPTAIQLDIKYEDEYLLIINKPPNMLVHPAKYNDTETLANAVIHYYNQHNMFFGFHPVHRLDRNTSGLVLVAKLPYIQHLLSKDVKTISRIYWGITEGTLTSPYGVINAPIDRRPGSIIERIVCPTGQPAVTKYKIIETLQDANLVELELETGRTHQIRVHMSYIGHPLLGDNLYGGSTQLFFRQALHAVRLCFNHPVTNKPIEVSTPPPEDFHQVLLKLSY
ncbi:hypothetical protein SDC9_27529 [bioreactor metagenome]|uniref:Pseudouridine synthase RsuA/RluA-like domain-containing protein n=1 Tax=bioreactor metagenome TaxID=1076179 RepID=A0A644URU2_9ZZZZ